MKKFYIYSLFVLTLVASELQGQELREVFVEPERIGILNDRISGDTTDTGERVNLNTVYVLRRNGVYKTTGEIQNPGFPLYIRAEEGDGAMPIIQPAATSGGESARPFTVLNDIRLEGLYITSIDELGQYIQRILRVRADDVEMRIDNCWLDGSGQSAVRLDNVNAKVYISNSIISNMGRPSVPNNGRVIDCRTNTDSVVVRNCTVYNVTSRIIRLSGGRFLRYGEFMNNTIMNTGQTAIQLDETIETVFVNNLMINAGFLGSVRSDDPFEIVPVGEAAVNTFPDVEQTAIIRNNLWYTQPEVVAARPDTVVDRPIYSSDVFLATDLDSATLVDELTFSEPVNFENAPTPSAAVVSQMVIDQATLDNLDDATAPNWNLFGSPAFQLVDQTLALPWQFPYSLSYSTTDFAATAATDGGSLGDRNWPLKDLNPITDLAELLPAQDDWMVFPNPSVGNQLYIQLSDDMIAQQIAITNLLGQQMLEVSASKSQKYIGVNTSSLNVGIYLVRVTEPNGKISTRKFIKK